MKNSAIYRKLMLLHHRLPMLNGIEGKIPGGVIRLTTEGKPSWIFEFANGDNINIIEKKVLADYVRGRTIQTQKIRVLDKELSTIYPDMEKISSAPVSDPFKLSVYDFGRHIGLSRDECRYVIDKEYASNFPMISALSYTKKKAEEFCRSNSGGYYLYRYDINTVTRKLGYTNGVLIRAGISIRYPVPHKPYTYPLERHCNIRVKMNMPSYLDKHIPFYQYDGLVGQAGRHWWAWMFQGRFGDSNRDIEDLMMMYTGSLKNTDKRVTRGQMLTQNQDMENTPNTSNVILISAQGFDLIEKENEAGESFWRLSPSEDEFMVNAPKVIDMSKPDQWTSTDKVAVSMLLSADKSDVFVPPQKL